MKTADSLRASAGAVTHPAPTGSEDDGNQSQSCRGHCSTIEELRPKSARGGTDQYPRSVAAARISQSAGCRDRVKPPQSLGLAGRAPPDSRRRTMQTGAKSLVHRSVRLRMTAKSRSSLRTALTETPVVSVTKRPRRGARGSPPVRWQETRRGWRALALGGRGAPPVWPEAVSTRRCGLEGPSMGRVAQGMDTCRCLTVSLKVLHS